MTDKELIKQEIDRLIERAQAERVLHPKTILSAKNLLLIEDYNKLLSFINSLPEEPACKDLEEAEEQYARAYTDCDNGNGGDDWEDDIKITFKAGAEWHKKQLKETLQTEYEKGRFDMREEMMKDAVEGVVHHFADDDLAAVHYNDSKGTPMSIYVSSKGLSAGDKVKIIIVKTE